MTTEIAILNKSAVALAADSAVTISRRTDDGDSQVSKIYVDANKLFELVKGVPVGVMIYNSAELAGVPWETLVKVYRTKHRLIRFDTLQEYVDHFLSFVQDRVPAGLNSAAESAQLMLSLGAIYREVYGQVQPHLIAEPKKVQRRKILTDALTQFEQELAAAPLQSWAAGLDEGQLWSKWGKEIIDALPASTDEVSLSLSARKQFAKLLLSAFLRLADPRGVWSGLVISGFGEEEFFPGVFHVQVGGVFEGRIVSLSPSLEAISNDVPAIIQPYAQTGEATMFLQGIDPAASNAVTTFWGVWARDLHKAVGTMLDAEVPNASSSEKKEFSNKVKGYVEKSWDAFADFMNEELHKKRLEPIEASAGFLSKREIADLAENLVDLTSLRNRVSLDRQETVGGATDVAVISKGDGFVWVKRKHYFERDRNPTWGLQHAVADVVSRLDRMGLDRGPRDGA